MDERDFRKNPPVPPFEKGGAEGGFKKAISIRIRKNFE